jgi:hypothetical protein
MSDYFYIAAFLGRKEIRDAYDIEFLLKRGVPLPDEIDTLAQLLGELAKLKNKNLAVKLGSLLGATQRKYYLENNFRILKAHIQEKLEMV